MISIVFFFKFALIFGSAEIFFGSAQNLGGAEALPSPPLPRSLHYLITKYILLLQQSIFFPTNRRKFVDTTSIYPFEPRFFFRASFFFCMHLLISRILWHTHSQLLQLPQCPTYAGASCPTNTLRCGSPRSMNVECAAKARGVYANFVCEGAGNAPFLCICFLYSYYVYIACFDYFKSTKFKIAQKWWLQSANALFD